MAGVYIKGFQLPEKSDMYYVKVECEPEKNPVATIWRRDVLGPMSFGAFEIIPLREDHGSLVDVDILPAYLANYPFKCASYDDWEKLCEGILSAPQVIPEDKETMK